MKEAGIDIEVVMPLEVQHFVRDDGQKITMIIFLCVAKPDQEIRMSEEHVEFKWLPVRTGIDLFPNWLHSTVEIFRRFKLDQGLE